MMISAEQLAENCYDGLSFNLESWIELQAKDFIPIIRDRDVQVRESALREAAEVCNTMLREKADTRYNDAARLLAIQILALIPTAKE